MVIYEATSSNFKKYGRIVKNIDFAPVIEALNQIAFPADSETSRHSSISIRPSTFASSP